MTAPCPAMGFHALVEMVRPLSEVALAGFKETWALMLAGRGLTGGGGGYQRVSLWVSGEAAQATEEDRLAVMAWLDSRIEVERFEVGPLHDLREDR